MTKPKIETVLIAKTRQLLLNRPRNLDYLTIERDTGLTPRWLTSFASDCADDYGAVRVETLYVYLSGKALKL